MAIAVSDVGVALLKWDNTASKYKYFMAITAAPATGGAGSNIEVTELDSKYKQYIADREDTPAYEFDFNYTASTFNTAETTFDGVTSNKFALCFQDKGGFTFEGIGTCWTDAVSAGQAIVGKISIAVSKREWIQDLTSVVDTTGWPAGRFNPFA